MTDLDSLADAIACRLGPGPGRVAHGSASAAVQALDGLIHALAARIVELSEPARHGAGGVVALPADPSGPSPDSIGGSGWPRELLPLETLEID